MFQDKYKTNSENKEKADERARNGMKNLREERSDAKIKQQRKPWDEKYNEKRKMTTTSGIKNTSTISQETRSKITCIINFR